MPAASPIVKNKCTCSQNSLFPGTGSEGCRCIFALGGKETAKKVGAQFFILTERRGGGYNEWEERALCSLHHQ